MTMNRLARTVIASSMALPLVGCIGWWGPADVASMISQSSGLSISREIGVNVNGLTLAFVGALAPDDLPISLSDISAVDFGVYRIESSENRSIRELQLPGWQRVVRMRESDEDVLAFVKTGSRTVATMLVIVRDGDELVIARVRGRLDKLLSNSFTRKSRNKDKTTEE